MTVRYKISDIKELPIIEIPEGYSVRYAKPEPDGSLSYKDKIGWTDTHMSGNREDGYPMDKFFADVSKQDFAEGAIFADFEHEVYGSMIVGSMIVEINREGEFDIPGITKQDALLRHGAVLEKYRHKGLYKAMAILVLKYCIDKKVPYLYSTPNDWLVPFWRRVCPTAEDVRL